MTIINKLSSEELHKLIEASLNEQKAIGSIKELLSPEQSTTKLQQMLKELIKNEKFYGFLKINDLDPVKFFSISERVSNWILSDTQTTLQKQTSWSTLQTNSSFADLNLNIDEFFKFSYILARRLEKEEYERLKTEEQYQRILETQIEQSQAIERREKKMRDKLKGVANTLEEE